MPRLLEQRLRRAHREVADVLVLGRDVLAAQAELLDDHLLRDAAARAPTSAAVIQRSGRYAAVAASETRVTAPRARRG